MNDDHLNAAEMLAGLALAGIIIIGGLVFMLTR